MKAVMVKELREGARSYRFLIIAVAFVFFALADPLILKFLPEILKTQTGMSGIAEFMIINQKEAIKSYIGDVTQIVPIVTAFTIGGIITKEYVDHYLDIPLSKGLSIGKLYVGKWLVYSGMMAVLAVLAISINYLYASMLFGEGLVSIAAIIRIVLMVSLLLIYYVSLHLLIETLVNKSYVASILSIAAFFAQYGALYAVAGRLRHLMPLYLMYQSTSMAASFRAEDMTCMVLTALYCLLLLLIGQLTVSRRRIY